jgi:hypothetical protein
MEDLVVLMYNFGDEFRYNVEAMAAAKVLSEASSESGFAIDLKGETWSYLKWKNVPIGNSVRVAKKTGNIIGVYDRRYASQLTEMCSDAVEANEEFGPGCGGDEE